jgi:hypothetical protein
MSHYYVQPRYTPGTPATVDFETAQRVAKQERAAYEDELHLGIFSRRDPNQTDLGGIVEYRWEERRDHFDGWGFEDVLTKERGWRKTEGAKPDCIDSNEHEINPATIHFQNMDNDVVIAGQCRICEAPCTSQPILLHWNR